MSSFLYEEAITLFFPRWSSTDYKIYQVDRFKKTPFVELFFSKSFYLAKILQQHEVKALMILKRNKTYKLLYDYHWGGKQKDPILVMLFEGSLCILKTNSLQNLPKEALHWSLPKFIVKQSLGTAMLSLYSHQLTPEEKTTCLTLPKRITKTFKPGVQFQRSFPHRSMFFHYVLSWNPVSLASMNRITGPKKTSLGPDQLCVFFYGSCFYFISHKQVVRFKTKLQPQRPLSPCSPISNCEKPISMLEPNRKMGIQLPLEGLTLAYHLGLLTDNTWAECSQQCLRLQSYLFPHYAFQEENLVHVLYYNATTWPKGKSFYFHTCHDYKKWFQFLKKEQICLHEKKKKLFNHLLNSLQVLTAQLTGKQHVWRRLLFQLEQYTQRLVCYFFDTNDLFLLNIQLYFAYYSKVFYNRTSKVNTNSTHTMTGLINSYWSFQNMFQWIGSNELLHDSESLLKHQDTIMDWLKESLPEKNLIYFPTPSLEKKPEWLDPPYAMAKIIPKTYRTVQSYCHARAFYFVLHLETVVSQWITFFEDKF